MKIKTLGKPTPKPVKQAKKGKSEAVLGQYIVARQQFEALRPVQLRALKGSVIEMPLTMRPYLSRQAKELGIQYITINLGNEKMLVLRYSTKPVK